eukprot:TRINITY_DN11319_c0_g1_i5.p1 TRINITY_DN11319_c0_g1~~TRINITY_DN11319_c0_g1_i5.p1  ORF type:complete len:388 (-),score=43.71 TRINITY_DN11319_c0_g1_i5:364-1527(-)
MYGLAPSMGWLLAGRLVSGLGASNMACCNAYIVTVCPGPKLSDAFMWLVMCGYLGWVAAPGIGRAFAHTKFHIADILVDASTIPAFLSAAMAIVNLLLVAVVLQAYPGAARATQNTSEVRPLMAAANTGDLEEGRVTEKPSSKKQVSLCRLSAASMALLTARFYYTTAFSLMETQEPAISEREYGWGVAENSDLLLAGNLLAIGAVLAVQQISSRCFGRYDFAMCVLGTLLMLVGIFACADVGARPAADGPPGSVEIISAMSRVRFVAGFTFVSVAGVCIVGCLPSLLAKVEVDMESESKQIDSAQLMSYEQAAGSLGRVLGPMVAMWLLVEYGEATLCVAMGSLGFVPLALLVLYCRPLTHAASVHADEGARTAKLEAKQLYATAG